MDRSLKSNTKQEIHDKILYGSLLLVAATLPFSLLANSLSIIVLFTNWLAEGRFAEKVKVAKSNLLFLTLILFYVFHIIGMAYTQNMNEGFFELQKKLSLLIFPLILATSRRMSPAQVINILKVFFTSILIASLICLGYATYRTNIIQTFPNVNWLFFSYRDLTMLLNIQHTYLALYVCFSILFLFYLWIENNSNYSKLKKGGLLFLVLYFTFFLFLLASRAAIAALIAILFSGIIYYSYKTKQILKGVLLISMIAGFLLILIFQMPFMKERFLLTLGIEQETVWINQYGDGVSKPTEDRKKTWTSAWNIIKENYLIGVGTGDVQDALQIQHENSGFKVGYESRLNAHNQYLETWIGIGAIGLISFLSCLIFPAVQAFRKKNYLHLSFLALMGISFVTECMLCRQQGVVFYSLFTSLLAFHCLDNNESEKGL